jgi:hypothetical protein
VRDDASDHSKINQLGPQHRAGRKAQAMTPHDQKVKQAHVTLDGEPLEIQAGESTVLHLKELLGVEPAAVLYLLHGHERQLLGDHETIEVKSGLKFEAVRGGGVS